MAIVPFEIWPNVTGAGADGAALPTDPVTGVEAEDVPELFVAVTDME